MTMCKAPTETSRSTIEIDGAKYFVPPEVAGLLQSVSEERDALLDWLRMNATHKSMNCIPGLRCECGLANLIGNP